MEKIERHMELIRNLLERKNNMYGDAFHQTWEEYGLLSVCIRLTDKLSRLKNLEKRDLHESFPAIWDTLSDIIGYSLLALTELEEKDKEIIARDKERRRNYMLTEVRE
mgnify:CR=1 FL=1